MVTNQKIHRSHRPDNSEPISIQEEIADEEEETDAKMINFEPAAVEAQADAGTVDPIQGCSTLFTVRDMRV
ncbi:hypothetical protein [Methylosinus sp. Ce-a6]|uniref:hypothetical protein n=1 Tax=Methylosinus sp. Ce-a6 TaxID=2172005 RepID=UPI0013567706|nr:hypothetical protein [Methylosinus sp. Ce-a6]